MSVSHRTAAETLATNVASAAMSFVGAVLLAKYFGPAGRGDVAAVMLWPGFASALALLGLPHAIVYAVATDRDRAGEHVGTGAGLAVASGVVVGVVTQALLGPLLHGASPDVLGAARVFTLIVVLQPPLAVLFHPLRALGRMRAWNAVRLLVDAIPLLALGVLLVSGSKSYVLYAGVNAALVGAAAVVALAISLRLGVRPRFARNDVRRHLAYGLPTLLATLPFLLNFRVDQYFVLSNAGRTELGVYAVAVAWSQVVLPALNAVAYLVLPQLVSGSGPERAPGYLRMSAAGALTLGVPLAIVSPFVVPLVFGEAYRRSGQLAALLVPATTLLGYNTVFEEVLRALGRPRLPMIAQSSALVVTFASLPWATRAHGAWGATGVSVVAYSVAFAVLARQTAGLCGTPVRTLVVPGRVELGRLVGIARGALARLRAGRGGRDSGTAIVDRPEQTVER